ncbi:hypothetical protein AAVH_22543, partial [Aphelenchoides avenae]
ANENDTHLDPRCVFCTSYIHQRTAVYSRRPVHRGMCASFGPPNLRLALPMRCQSVLLCRRLLRPEQKSGHVLSVSGCRRPAVHGGSPAQS